MSEAEFKKIFNDNGGVGNAEVQYQIGREYHYNMCRTNVGWAPTEALKWYKLAADQGHAKAQLAYGTWCEMDNGVKNHHEEAAKYYQMLADNGNVDGQWRLGFCFKDGNGIEKNYSKAVRWLDSAAEQGCVEANYGLGEIYRVGGYGVDKDLQKAKDYYEIWLKLTDSEIYRREVCAIVAEITKEIAIARRTKVFVSYSHKDAGYLDELRPYLGALSNIKGIESWYDREIRAGEEWAKVIEDNLEQAKVAIFLVSADFFASKYAEAEMKALLEAAKDEGALILWVPLRSFPYKHTLIAKYQSIIDPAKPLADYDDKGRDKVYANLIDRIVSHFEEKTAPTT